MEREWKQRRINLEVQRVQHSPGERIADRRRIIHYFCAVNPPVFCCLRKTKLHSGAVCLRIAWHSYGLTEIERTERAYVFYCLIIMAHLRLRMCARNVSFSLPAVSRSRQCFYFRVKLSYKEKGTSMKRRQKVACQKHRNVIHIIAYIIAILLLKFTTFYINFLF